MLSAFVPDISPDLALAESLIQSFEKLDTLKREYLGYRVAGFSKRESMQLANVEPAQIVNWLRRDRGFKEVERHVNILIRQDYHKTLTSRRFTRIMHLAMIKDEQMFRKSIDTPDIMSSVEWAYLRTIRSLYSPQQYTQLEGMFKAVGADNWDELLIVAKRNTQGVI